MKSMLHTLPLGILLAAAVFVFADDFDEPPINYRDTAPKNRVSRLMERIEQGKVSLAAPSALESLRLLLAELKVPESSQMLVFSKTSLQRDKISPRTPRALYFNDDVYVGYCQGSDVLELSAVDPALGTVFYTAERSDAGLEFERQTDNCLLCHSSSSTRQVPGNLVRSVYVDLAGLPVLSMGTHRIDQTSPIKNRWGGWYVTGTHGSQTHLGNLLVRGRLQPEEIDNSAGQNVTSLQKLLKTENYLTPHSDLVALMVLEHQVEGHNLMVRASFQCRMALHQQAQLNKELGESPDHQWESTKSRIRNASEDLVKYLLFCEEAAITSKLAGTSSFTTDFATLGPRDRQGRSLREFDLERRLFRYGCSYLVYSEAFEGLPQGVRDHVWQRIWEVVSEQDQSKTFAHLSANDRRELKEILLETVKSLPAYWK